MSRRVLTAGIARGRIEAPGSKSYTHRALLLAALSGRRVRVDRPLESEDTWATVRGLRALGSRVRTGRTRWVVEPRTRAGPKRARIDCRESGTTLRFLLPLAARSEANVDFLGAEPLRRRPLEPLLAVLRAGGVNVDRPAGARGIVRVLGPLRPVDTTLDPSESSQFASALLLTLPSLDGPSRLRLDREEVSRPYVAATRAILRSAGVRVRRLERGYVVPAPQRYRATAFEIPGDASSAAYLWGAAAATGGSVAVEGIDRRWPQADLAVLPWLRRMGASVRSRGTTIEVEGPIDRPIDVDLSDAPDLLPLMTALAALVPGVSHLRGATHAAGKESDRRTESARLARAAGASVRVDAARLEIRGRRHPRPLRYEGPSDHRLVMSAALIAVSSPGRSWVGPAESVRKSYPEFWAALGALGLGSGVRR